MANKKHELNFKNVDKIFEKIQKEKVNDLVAKKFGEIDSRSMIFKKSHIFLQKLISRIKK